MTNNDNADFRQWNRLANGMNRYHNSYRWEYKNVYENAAGGFHVKGQSLQGFLQEAAQLAIHLGNHHRVEEAHIFPLLAKKLPQFAATNSEHVKAHRGIHDGMAKYSAYLSKATANPSSYNASELRKIMDDFHDVLFDHLDQEVKDIGAESLKKAGFTLQELSRFPF